MLRLPVLLQRLINGNHVRRLAEFDEACNLTEDAAVIVSIKISLIDDVADTLPYGVVDQQTAQQRLLRLDGMRGQTQGGHHGIFCLTLRFTHGTSTGE
jgi:hypothetical protein